jgi:hypothetical protein
MLREYVLHSVALGHAPSPPKEDNVRNGRDALRRLRPCFAAGPALVGSASLALREDDRTDGSELAQGEHRGDHP